MVILQRGDHIKRNKMRGKCKNKEKITKKNYFLLFSTIQKSKGKTFYKYK